MKERNQTCDNIFKQIKEINFPQWQGIPGECDYSNFDANFTRISDIFGANMLGKSIIQTHYRVYKIDGYSGNLCAWFRENELILIEAKSPQFTDLKTQKDLIAAFGNPVAKLSYSQEFLLQPEGEWIYPGKGISLFLDDTKQKIMQINLFHSCTLEHYIQTIRNSYERSEEFPTE
ncbi:MAG: hypothetical protein JXB88_20395 [Spirochaetales bacterium]|nr:hypothetical protein [Spirochaetales bacterium]